MKDKRKSVLALEGTNFFLADVQTGLGPFLAAYLAGAGWKPGRVGVALTVGGVITVLLQTPAGAIVDQLRRKRAILILATLVLAIGAILLLSSATPLAVYTSQVLIGATAPFLGPTLAAITMGIVGARRFDRQFGINQSFNSAGNVFCALIIAGVSHVFGNRAIFLTAAVLVIPTIACISMMRGSDIDYEAARGSSEDRPPTPPEGILKTLLGNPALLIFFLCAFCFHFANAAMLPQLGEMLSRGSVKSAAPFMSACIIVTQCVIMVSAAWVGRLANTYGRKPLLLLGFGVLPIRAVLYVLIHKSPGLIAVQLLDGVANCIFGVVSVLVVADLTRGTGRFNLVQGGLATAVGIGAALSTTFGGKLVEHFSFGISFLGLGAVSAIALLLLITVFPETLNRHPVSSASTPLFEGVSR
jgi:MFS family permease